ncbi:MAG: metal-dependent hydrolase [Alphaproteobacteria bacterium]|nr:metal-dependent hydrolase [Alphaproteobacteria bacterium]
MSPALAKSVKTQPDDITNHPRDIAFVRGGPKNEAWAGGDRAKTAVFNALSITFPPGERFFIDAVKHYRGLASGKLADDVKDFIIQESLHTREHIAFNQLMDPEHYPVAAIEAILAERMKIGRSKGPLAMLMITTALEHFTAILADAALRHPETFEDAPEEIRNLWLWHSLEETEHKAVAFDLMQRVIADMPAWRRYLLRARVMIITTTLFHMNILTFARMLLKADGITGWAAWRGVLGAMYGKGGLFRLALPAYFDWYRPGFHPWDHDNRDLLAKWRPLFETPSVAAAE